MNRNALHRVLSHRIPGEQLATETVQRRSQQLRMTHQPWPPPPPPLLPLPPPPPMMMMMMMMMA
jgi:hypothetical protein